MSDAFWRRRAKLFRFDGSPGEVGPRAAPLIEGTLAEVALHVRGQPSADWWRYSVAIPRKPDLSGAALRALIDRDDLPET